MGELGFKVVEAPDDFAIETVWADPRTVKTNPGNPKDHPAIQREEIESFILDHGWIQPLVYNRRLGRLIEGHERLSIAIENDWPAVPVWVGDWDEGDEASVILALNEPAKLATYNRQKAQEWLRTLEQRKPQLTAMAARLRSRESLEALVEAVREKAVKAEKPEPSESTEPQGPRDRAIRLANDDVVMASQVRQVTLIMTDKDLSRWHTWVEILQEHTGIESVTAIVLKVMQDAYTSALRSGIGKS